MSDRRKLLGNRLKQFVNEKLLSPYLPVKPSKLLGFGSFFRGKADPHDIDLSLIVSPHPDFPVTPDLMGCKIQNSWDHIGCSYLDEFDTWKSVLSDFVFDFDRLDDKIADVVKDVPGIPKHVAAWLGSYSRTSLFEQRNSYERIGTPLDVTRRMVKGVAGIKVMDVVVDEENLDKDRPYTLVWSPERPDIDANLAEVEKPSLAMLIRECQNLLPQLSAASRCYDKGVRFMTIMYKYEHGTRWSKNDEKNMYALLEYFRRHADPRYGLNKPPESSIPTFPDVDSFAKYVEALRNEVKSIKFRCEILIYVGLGLIAAKGKKDKIVQHSLNAMTKQMSRMPLVKSLTANVVHEVKLGYWHGKDLEKEFGGKS